MKKEIKKTSVNLVHKESTLNQDITNNLIDVILSQSASIMYHRQATYFYLIKVNGWTRTELHKAIKTRAESQGLPYNKGVTQKESLVAEYAILKLKRYFTSVTIDKKNPESTINIMADIMQKNKIAYNYLKDKLVKNPKDSQKEESQDSQKEEVQEVQEVKEVKQVLTLDSVIDFIKNASQDDCLKLADVLSDTIKRNADKKQVKKAA